jgi:hypothetical protein
MEADLGRIMKNRRKLILALGARALTAPLGSFAQQPAKMYRIGFLDVGSGTHRASLPSLTNGCAVVNTIIVASNWAFLRVES